MKPFHTQTRYFPVGSYRVQFTLRHIRGPHWDGTPCPEAQTNTVAIKPFVYKHEQECCGFTTITYGVGWLWWITSIELCDVRKRAS